MLIYNGQVIAGGGTIVLPMTRAEYEANKAVLDTADVWVDLTDEPDQVASADEIAYWVGQTQKGMGYIGDIATKAIAKVEPTDTALYLHAVGTYFINKDGNTCVTDVQIPVGGTITLNTNCHVCSDGVANDINSNLNNKSGPIRTGYNTNYADDLYLWVSTQGSTVTVVGMVHVTQPLDSWAGFQIIPSGIIPMAAGGSGNITGVALNTTNGGLGYVGTNSGDDLSLIKVADIGWYRFSISYVKN